MAHVATSGIILLEADEHVEIKYNTSSQYTDSNNSITRGNVETNLVVTPIVLVW